MKEFVLEEGIPIPKIVPRNNKYNLHKMTIGQSFTVDEFNPTDIQKLRVAISNYSRRNNKEFTTRKIEENGAYRLRVWRKA